MKSLRFAFVGLGSIAKTHIVALKALSVIKDVPIMPVLDTLVTRNPDERMEQASRIGFVNVASSLEETLLSREIDIVDICTPNALHAADVRIACNAGKSIYCEKPLTERYENSLALTVHANEVQADHVPGANVSVHQVALVNRYHPAVMRMKAALEQGMIGDVLQCIISYRRSGYLNAARPVSWRLSEQLSGGGAITDLGVHVLDMMRYLCGEVTAIHGVTNTFVKRRPIRAGSSEMADMRVDDWAQMHVEFGNGIKGTAEVSRIAWGAEAHEMRVIGTKGSLTCDLEKDVSPTIRLLDGSSPVLPEPSSLFLAPDEKSTLGLGLDSHLAALHHFLYRAAGEDRWHGIAPTFHDCLRAEQLIAQVLAENANELD